MMSKHTVVRFAGTVAALMLLAPVQQAISEPLAGVVVGGSATISGQGTGNLVINQASQAAIINWQSFNIGVGQSARFNQPSAAAIALNRVTGSRAPSEILGSLTANGRVYLVNPEGFIFGPGATINTAGFLATTHDIRNEDFMAGRYVFGISGNPSASIINQGTIRIADTGIAALVAPGVRNDGIITARLGKVALASAYGFTLDLYGDNLINFTVSTPIAAQVIDPLTGQPMKNLVENRAKLSANGGVVALTATTARAVVNNVINNSGVVEARSVGLQNGRIVLGATTAKTKAAGAPEQKVSVSGTLDASGSAPGQTGGSVQITGESISVTNAKIDASGGHSGGKVLVGGDYMGGNPNPAIVASRSIVMETAPVPTAANVTVTSDVTIDASATAKGDGGKVVIWSDGTTTFKGEIRAKGGAQGGNGGFAEVSGWRIVDYAGMRADLTAPKGKHGGLLLDPAEEVIDSAKAQTISSLLNQGADVVVYSNTSGNPINPTSGSDLMANIRIVANILKTAGGDATLEIYSYNGIIVAPGVVIGSSSGKLNVKMGGAEQELGAVPTSLADLPRVIFGAGARIYTNGGIALMNPAFDAQIISFTEIVPIPPNVARDPVARNSFVMDYYAAIRRPYVFDVTSTFVTSPYDPSATTMTLSSTIVPGSFVPSPIASSGPLPGIGLTILGQRIEVPFGTIVPVAQRFGVSPEDTWRISRRLDGTVVAPSPAPVALADIKPGAGPEKTFNPSPGLMDETARQIISEAHETAVRNQLSITREDIERIVLIPVARKELEDTLRRAGRLRGSTRKTIDDYLELVSNIFGSKDPIGMAGNIHQGVVQSGFDEAMDKGVVSTLIGYRF